MNILLKVIRSLSIATVFGFAFTVGSFSFATHASAAGNVKGFAWSDSAGWISMNCDNSNIEPPDNNVPSTCGTVDYGVTVDPATGAITGYAWSTNLGWLKFDSNGTTPTYIANRMGNARVSGITVPGVRIVTGFARFCSSFTQTTLPDNCTSGITTTNQNGGWNGWVSMMGDGSDGLVKYGVTFNTDTQAFDGFAWGGTIVGNGDGSEVVGWISFNNVYVDKRPVAYVPIVKLSGMSPIQQGQDTKIDYYWTNADLDPLHKIVSCSAFTDQGQVANWNAGAISGGNLPTGTLQTKLNVFAYYPQTTYYLDCKAANGQHVADPSNPTMECNTSTPATTANTCPRTAVDVIKPGADLQLGIMLDGDPFYSTGLIFVPQTSNVSLQWTSTGGLVPGSCKSSSSAASYWPVGNLSDPTASVTGINLDRNPTVTTTYTVTCKRASDNTNISASAQAKPLPPVVLNPQLTIGNQPCVQNSGVGFNLRWGVTGGNGGQVRLRNDGGDSNWDGTYVVTGTSGIGTNLPGLLHVTNPTRTIFYLLYSDINGNTYPEIQYPVPVDPACNAQPSRNWFFRFFER